MSAYTEYFAAVKACSNAAQRELASVWNSLDLSDPAGARNIMLELLPAIVERYGDAAATAAAEMYEAVMYAELGTARNVAIAANDTLGMMNSVRFAAGLVFNGEHARAASTLARALDYYVKRPARDTVIDNVAVDRRLGARWARVPQGIETCEFCIMLASRGFVYHSKSDAIDGYHTDCDCMPVVSFSDDPYVEGYDPEHYYDLYREMKDKGKWNMAREAKRKTSGRM